MRTPTNIISPLIIFWGIIYVLALLSISIAGILARSQEVLKLPAPKPIRSNQGFRP